MEQGLQLRCLYRYLGWKRRQCAQFFHVSERTLHNWESGATAIPFAVMKLLRIHCRYELPGQAWEGWVFHSGKLWTPEGAWFVASRCCLLVESVPSCAVVACSAQGKPSIAVRACAASAGAIGS